MHWRQPIIRGRDRHELVPGADRQQQEDGHDQPGLLVSGLSQDDQHKVVPVADRRLVVIVGQQSIFLLAVEDHFVALERAHCHSSLTLTLLTHQLVVTIIKHF